MGRAPLAGRYLYFIWGERLRRIRPTDSIAALSACAPTPENCAAIRSNEVPPDGASPPWPNTSSRPDVFDGGKCFFARNKAERNSEGGARRSPAIQGHITRMSRRTDDGSHLSLYSSTTDSRRLAASNARHMLQRNCAAALGAQALKGNAKWGVAAPGGSRPPTQSPRTSHFPAGADPFTGQNEHTFDITCSSTHNCRKQINGDWSRARMSWPQQECPAPV